MAGRNSASPLHGGFAAAVPVQATSGTNAYARLFDRHSRRRAPLSHADYWLQKAWSGVNYLMSVIKRRQPVRRAGKRRPKA